jgi:Phenazine biosynthesis-like protein
MQVDAFTDVPFGGNPAAIVLVPPPTKLEDAVRQQIAVEMNLAETAFLEPLTDAGEPCTVSETPLFRSASRYRLRWFTPLQESEMCGHATLASAAALVQGALGSHAICSGSDAAVGHSHVALADSPVGADVFGHKMWNVQYVPCDSMQRSYMQAHHHAHAGEGHPADKPLLFDTVYSGQLSVERLSREAQPLLQLGMPWWAPVDRPPAGITAESALIQVRQDDHCSIS